MNSIDIDRLPCDVSKSQSGTAEADARGIVLRRVHAAAQHGDQEMSNDLLANGADPTLRTDDGRDATAMAPR